MKNEQQTRITITVPADLKRHLKERAAKNDRTFSREIVRSLKFGSGWTEENKKDEAAA